MVGQREYLGLERAYRVLIINWNITKVKMYPNLPFAKARTFPFVWKAKAL